MAKKTEIKLPEAKLIDTTSKLNIQALKLDDLIGDAIARKDKKAIEWLMERSAETIVRNGKTIKKPVNMYRKEYLEKFCNLPTKTAALTREQKRKAIFTAALEAIEKATSTESAE